MREISPEIFKAYDIRGIYPSQLNEETAEKIGKAVAVFSKAKTALVARDVRLSSKSLSECLIKGLSKQGVNVIDLGLCSTAQLYFASGILPNDIAVIVTASHNPKEYNGFKICKKGAIALSGPTGIFKIRDLVLQGSFSTASKKGIVLQKDFLKEYQEFFMEKTGSFPFKVVIDTANSVGLFDARILEKICTVIPLFFELDGSFPNHIGNPLNYETLKPLQKKVIKEKADLGIAFDGDADRVSFIDEKGKLVPNDIITALLARFFPKESVLFDARSTKQIESEIKKFSGNPVRCRIGHVFIKEKMREINAAFAGELSGHYYYRQLFFAESPLQTILLMLKLLKQEKKSLSELSKTMQKFFQSGEINSTVKNQKSKMLELEKHYSKQSAKISYLDGITIEFPDWWCNIRSSNTEPLLRLNLEADSKKLMKTKTEEVLKLIRS